MTKSRTGTALSHLALILVCIVAVFPFYWMLTTAMKPREDIFLYPPQMFPGTFDFGSFPKVFELMPMAKAYVNSTMVAVLTTVGTLFTCSLAAYAFAKIPFRGSGTIFGIFLSTMMIPFTIILIPLYLVFSKLHWIDTMTPLIVPSVMMNAYGVFLIKQFMSGIPTAYIESAKLDGANHFKIFLKIMVPLCKPALITLGLFTFIGKWNEFVGPLIFLNSEEHFTIPLIIASFQGVYTIEWGLLMSAATVAVVPIMIMYLLTQKYYIEGIALSGVKG
ncbi:carbohydrate ABC transporter permease [Cohnella sp. 56]|uniref:carbohydrate ABC transporter permease n=1 Tax=Cohnella sp. 56 TaxID=3113722 RepID=UPI0030E9EB42